jgi:hypothetical protein
MGILDRRGMRILGFATGLLGCAGLGLASGVVQAQEVAAKGPPAPILQPFVHLYVDAQGVSHFLDETMTVRSGTAGPAQLELSQLPGASLLALKRGAKEDWHRAPRRLYLIALKGMSEVTAGDGQVRRFGPGSLLLMDDLTGKGHVTRAVGGEDHVALIVPAP